MKSKTFNTEKYSTLLKKATSLKKENISQATIFISTIASQTKKMKIKGSGLEMASDKLHILALAVQGRMASASQRMPHILDN